MNLTDKNVMVVGATGGIGRAIALAFAMEKTNLILVGRDKMVLNSLAKKSEAKGSRASVYRLDLTKPKDIAKLARKINKKYKRIDILINAAGIGIYKPFEKLQDKDWELTIALNTNAVFFVINALLPSLLRSKKSYVIGLGSGMGKIGVAQRSAYCTSKFALRGLILSLAKEYKKTNINFVLLTLGSVLTGFGPLSLEEKQEKQKSGKNYLTPSYIAHSLVTKIKNDSLETETSLYPKDYYFDSRKGKT